MTATSTCRCVCDDCGRVAEHASPGFDVDIPWPWIRFRAGQYAGWTDERIDDVVFCSRRCMERWVERRRRPGWPVTIL